VVVLFLGFQVWWIFILVFVVRNGLCIVEILVYRGFFVRSVVIFGLFILGFVKVIVVILFFVIWWGWILFVRFVELLKDLMGYFL